MPYPAITVMEYISKARNALYSPRTFLCKTDTLYLDAVEPKGEGEPLLKRSGTESSAFGFSLTVGLKEARSGRIALKKRRGRMGKPEPDQFGGVFALTDPKKKPDKDEEKKIKAILSRLHYYGLAHFTEANVEYALRARGINGNSEDAFRLLILFEDTLEGLVKPYNPETKLLGAENRESVTCYLDALLFSMFARLDSFEAMLYNSFEDLPRKKLAGTLRLWVNMLRTGRLVTTDIMMHLQDSLALCGWKDAARLQQQDPSEAFTFITGQLELPLLTLKMDLFHTGKEDPTDDHKFVNERLLEVAILTEPPEGSSVVTLEDCLEHYFNNRIEVKRHLEQQRRNTLQSIYAADREKEPPYSAEREKEPITHIDAVEIPETSDSPRASTPVAMTPAAEISSTSKDPLERVHPISGRKRGDSIFSQRKVEILGEDPEKSGLHESTSTGDRKLNSRTEVLMPAWQFFKLLPWYTDNAPTSDAQVAAHFSRKRPVLGICLKRYQVSNNGVASRLNTYIDIPLEITVPNFVSDDNMDDGPLVGNFRLLLQSVVCHRGSSVHSGHYICLVRGHAKNASGRAPSGEESDDEEADPWMCFDDLARDRVTYVDIHQALKHECPYLLFYQVQPIDEDGRSIHDLPTYEEATSRSYSEAVVEAEKPTLHDLTGSETALAESPALSPPTGAAAATTAAADGVPAPERNSLDVTRALSGVERRGRQSSSSDNRSMSIAFDESGFAAGSNVDSARTDANGSMPTTPLDDKPGGFLSVASLIGSRRASRANSRKPASRSRPPSTGPDSGGSNRFSLNMSKLTARLSRAEQPPSPMPVSEHAAAELMGETATVHSEGAGPGVAAPIKPLSEPARTRGVRDKEPKPHHHHLHHRKRQKGQDEQDCALM